MSSPVRDRFCPAQRWWDGAGGPDLPGFVTCGGELRYARRVEGELIVSYLVCLFCGNLIPMLEYDLTTGKDRALR